MTSDERSIRAGLVADALERAAGVHADPLGEARAFLEAHGRADLIDKPTIGRYRARRIRRLERQLRAVKAEVREVLP